jgi:hypothetical protein
MKKRVALGVLAALAVFGLALTLAVLLLPSLSWGKRTRMANDAAAL